MDRTQIYQEKLKMLISRKEKKKRFVEHLEHQQQRLDRIGELLECSPDEARELLNLMLLYWQSEGVITSKGLIKPKIPK